MMTMMMLIWILPIVLIVWAMGSRSGNEQPQAEVESPLEILRRRYASGEITYEEFEQRKRALA